MAPPKDSGWSGAVRGLAWVLVPGLAARRVHGSSDRLGALRSLFVTFAVGLLLVGVVVAVLEAFASLETTMSVPPVIAMVTAFGLLTLAAGRFAAPPFDCSSASALAESFSKRFFLRLAFAESAALVGFVGYILSGSPLTYVVGLAFSAVGFLWLAPTDRHLEADQQVLQGSGCQRSLLDALTEAPQG